MGRIIVLLIKSFVWWSSNRPRSIYQYSSMAPGLSGQNCKCFKFLLSLNSQKRQRKQHQGRSLTWKPQSHVRILIYRTWPIAVAVVVCWNSQRSYDGDAAAPRATSIQLKNNFIFSRQISILLKFVKSISKLIMEHSISKTIGGFHRRHENSKLKKKVAKSWSSRYFTSIMYKRSWKLLFIQIFSLNGFLVL